ncbi:MAG: glycosyltransferase [Thermodesulfobacteriota bacterium]
MVKDKELNNEQLETPRVSVIMNCYNGEKYLKESIDSVYKQTYQNWEIIFWDNASTDRSAEIARRYDNKLKYFRGDKTVPLYAARNYALKRARGKYIAILDCDDLWLPTKLEEQLPLLEKDERVGLVYSDAFLFNEKGKEKRSFESRKPYRNNIFSELLLCNFINTQTVVIRNKAFDNLEYWFDSRLNITGDLDAYLRISYKWKVDYVDRPLVRYRVHRDSTTYKEGRDLLIVELDLMMENLKNVISDFEYKYPEEVKSLRKRRDVQLSLLDWERGNPKQARRRIRAHLYDNAPHFILYFLMYLPYRIIFKPCYKIYNKNVITN